MGKLKSEIRSTLSRLKTHALSLDLQDIYQSEAAFSAPVAAAPALEFKVLGSKAALVHVDDIRPMSRYDRQFALKRLAAGDKVVIGFREDMAVFYGWLMFDEMEMTYGVHVPVSKGTAFAYNLFTRPSFRRRGALSAFYRFTRDYLKSQNLHTLYCGIATNNQPSIKGHLKNGFHKAGFFYTFKILGVGFTLADEDYPKRLSVNWTKYSL